MIVTDSLLSLVAERAAVADEARRLDDEVVAAITDSGIHRLLVPAALGGREAHPRELIDAVARLGAADGSAAWCAAIGAGGNLFSGYVPEHHAREMFADPDAGNAGMFAPMGAVTGEGSGARLTGRWPFASNVPHSRWIGLGAWLKDADGTVMPPPRLLFVPVDDVEVEDTWHGAGLRATGSHHVRVSDLAVDLERSCVFGRPAWAEGPLWRMPLFTVLGPVLAAAPLGVARGALDHVAAGVRDGAGGMRGSVADDQVGLAALGLADAALRAAYAGLLGAVEDVWDAASAGGPVSRPLQARVALAVQYAMETAVASTSEAHRLCGGAAAYLGHPVLTALRDVETARQHVLFSRQHRPALTRIAAGIDEMSPPFVF